MRGMWLLAVLLLAGCQHVAAPPPIGGEIRDLRSGQVLTAQQLLMRLAEPERVIVGEQHDNADHHAAQLWFLQALGEQRPQGSLLLEMLTPDQQSKVDQVRQCRVRLLLIFPAHWPGRTVGTGISTGRLFVSPSRNRIRCWRPIWITAKSAPSIATRRF